MSTLFKYACFEKFDKVVERANTHPQEAKYQDGNGKTALHMLAVNKAPLACVTAVYFAYPEALEMKNSIGATPLDWAAQDSVISHFLRNPWQHNPDTFFAPEIGSSKEEIEDDRTITLAEKTEMLQEKETADDDFSIGEERTMPCRQSQLLIQLKREHVEEVSAICKKVEREREDMRNSLKRFEKRESELQDKVSYFEVKQCQGINLLNSLKEKIKTLQDEVNKLQCENKEIKNNFEEADRKHEQEKSELNNFVKNLDEDKTALQKKLADVVTDQCMDLLNNTKQNYAPTDANYEDDIHLRKERYVNHKELRCANEEIMQENISLKQKVAHLKKENELLDNVYGDVEELKAEIEINNEEMDSMAKETIAYERRFLVLKDENDELHNQLREMESEKRRIWKRDYDDDLDENNAVIANVLREMEEVKRDIGRQTDKVSFQRNTLIEFDRQDPPRRKRKYGPADKL
mmetsp:Transcript_10530/g.12833  ORF Transcript_10530/g.12833 Transcript_10530/m.12833 type:complete len:463 (+) Transcript_10530:168-1556(+)